MKNIGKKLAAVGLVLCTVGPAYAGKGGSATLIQQAVASGSQGGIIAEVERTEGLMCAECVQTVTNLLEDNRYAVREVAAWWFAKRPQLKALMIAQTEDDLTGADALHVRNAADFLGAVREFNALPVLGKAFVRGGMSSDAKLSIVRAVSVIAHPQGDSILVAAMGDADAGVRTAAVNAWRHVLGQTTAQPVEGLLADAAANVRAAAANVVGAYSDANARPVLEQLVVNDPDSSVRRNAAWALGKIGSAQSRAALTAASQDKSGLVNGVAKAALTTLK